ncbi:MULTISPECIES: DUF3256 family protein [Proteiniphilum]|uniref:DUF3256 family protein n=1 Tax=Proteiniphilum TaxID=294702 RepID=UPI001EEAC1C7|nr:MULTISPECIES: DUF3256 family protein [Proteiniphilum]ULB33616.1 DUF3256 family protein [Proteiniphilum propionicum]
MRKILLFLSIFVISVSYGQNIGDLFKSMPTVLLPGISEGNKTMLLVNTGKTTIPYTLGEISKIKQNDDILEIKTSGVGTIQLKLLPVAQDSMIICMIKTVCGEVCDSHITFYDTEWNEISGKPLIPDISEEFFFDSSKKEMENYKYAVSLPHIYPVSAKFSNDTSDLVLTFNYKHLLTADQIMQIEPFLKSDTVVLHWNNATFR